MQRSGEIAVTINADGTVRMQILNNDSPDHGELLKPFEVSVSDGDASRVQAHRHDHSHTGHVHHGHSHEGGH
ncbi:MAG TPA: hypothetical protein VGP72_05240 [Planctomycetota bacterium]|jgi:hypothetical protein